MRVTSKSFSALLPLAELAIWTVLILIPIGVIYFRFHQTAPNSETVTLRSGQIEFTVPRNGLISVVITAVTSQHPHIITVLNLPGQFVESLISLPISRSLAWHPQALPMDNWRTISFPFFCLPAWWFVGRGIDGLLGRIRLHQAMFWTGSVLCLMFLVILIGVLTSPVSDRADMEWLVPGLGFWTLAFGVLPLTWLMQRGIRSDSGR